MTTSAPMQLGQPGGPGVPTSPGPNRRRLAVITAAAVVVLAIIVTAVLVLTNRDDAPNAAPAGDPAVFDQYVDDSIAGATNLGTFLDDVAHPDFIAKVQPQGDTRCYYAIYQQMDLTLGNVLCGSPELGWWGAGSDLVDGQLQLETGLNPDTTIGETWRQPTRDGVAGVRPDGEKLPIER